MEEAMSETDWKTALRQDLVIHGFLAETDEERMAVVMPHIEAAYKRGLMAGKSQAGYRQVQALPGLALTKRQLEIACMTADGLTNKQIAEKLFLTENSVKTHLRIVYGKTGTRNRGHLAALLVARGHAVPQGEMQ
jgi:DNA-binding CsgD family transcriptional regulator